MLEGGSARTRNCRRRLSPSRRPRRGEVLALTSSSSATSHGGSCLGIWLAQRGAKAVEGGPNGLMRRSSSVQSRGAVTTERGGLVGMMAMVKERFASP
jgi:hypothetical protein